MPLVTGRPTWRVGLGLLANINGPIRVQLQLQENSSKAAIRALGLCRIQTMLEYCLQQQQPALEGAVKYHFNRLHW